MMRPLLLIAAILMLLAFIVAAGESTLAGAEWPVWATASLFLWMLDGLVDWTANRRP